jgi:hypothetical protein
MICGIIDTLSAILRRFLQTSAAAATAVALPDLPQVHAQSPRNLHFALPWVAEGSNLFTYVAKHRGLWAQHGAESEQLAHSRYVRFVPNSDVRHCGRVASWSQVSLRERLSPRLGQKRTHDQP